MAGFTLLELIVVIVLIGIMLSFSLPRFHQTLVSDPKTKTSRWLIGTVRALRQKAMVEQKRYALHIDMDAGMLWTSDESMTEEAVYEAAASGYRIPDGLFLTDVEYPLKDPVSSGKADVFFHPQGFSDPALIHLKDEDSAVLTLSIEPFLSEIGIFDSYRGYED
jgi:prepilin-type N-terminal cleavage/methylation domain-containing protein